MPLAPLIFKTSRSVAETTKRIPRSLPVTPFRLGPSKSNTDDRRNETSLWRLLLLLDATAAYALRGIDHIVLFFVEAGRNVRRWVISSTSQLRELGSYLKRTYHQEASKWTGGSEIIVFFGAVSFTVAVTAFDALIYVAEWFFDGREAREIEKREDMNPV